MKRAVFATICLFCIVVWPAAAQISPDLVAMAPAGEVDRLITTREFEINKPSAPSGGVCRRHDFVKFCLPQ